MTAATWFLLIGFLLIMMALTGTLLKALPISAAALYLVIGFAVGPGGFGLLDLELRQSDKLIEHVSEGAVLVSLFAVGLRLQIRTKLSSWVTPRRSSLLQIRCSLPTSRCVTRTTPTN